MIVRTWDPSFLATKPAERRGDRSQVASSKFDMIGESKLPGARKGTLDL